MVNTKTTKYNYSLMVLGLTLLGAIIVGFFIIKPLWDTTQKISKEKDEKSAILAIDNQRLEILNKLKDREDQLNKDSEIVSRALPTQEEVGRLFIQLDSLASESGGNLRSVSQISVGAQSGLSSSIVEQEYSIPIDMPSYFALKQFISKAGSSLQLLSISNIGITASEAGALTVSISAKSYTRGKS